MFESSEFALYKIKIVLWIVLYVLPEEEQSGDQKKEDLSIFTFTERKIDRESERSL